MFSRILIANRGEIACRIAATCRRLGVETVAVYSDVDRDAAHVAACDHAVHLGGPKPAESYLRGEAIIAAARDTGAEAIHPGYGFLSENPDFVQAVEAAGLVFIGPSAAAIRAMGLKDAAKGLMEKAGVPVVPGYHGADQDDAALAAAADGVGYPVLIKAVAGGGGKGMRRVDDKAGFADALASARAEAKGAFGNEAVLIEKCIERPRHIEVQVFGDGFRAVHLFERDCSLQRRHQKVIEEAPAPGMTDEVRAEMGAAAVRAAEAIGYSGAGTVEFIVDGAGGLRPDGFWFMEMNTRLQVEHPVTEAITGIDLVEWQLCVAAGGPLPASQQDITIAGHAFEARLYAEDVPAGFLPATGRLTHLHFPQSARIDTGVRAGDTISPHYDPMIAKITASGPDRTTALRRLALALDATEVAGCTTNLPFLRRLAADPDFAAGDVDTGLIVRRGETLTTDPEPDAHIWALAAVADRATGPLAGFALWGPLRQTVTLERAGVRRDLSVATTGCDRYDVAMNGETLALERRAGRWWVNGQPVTARVVERAGGIHVFSCDGFHFTRPDPLARGAAGTARGVIEAPMPGQIRSIHAEPGDAVAKGARLAVLEAMKMEHTLAADRDGVVAEVLVVPGQQVDVGAPIVRLEEEEQDP